MAIVDFTNPEACKWYKAKLRVLCEMGVDAFKTGFGERIPTADVVYSDGSDPYRMHNYYTYLYNKCVFEVLEEFYGKDKACCCSHVLLRSAVSSSLYTGAATASASTNQWLKRSVEDFHSAYQASATSATIFRALQATGLTPTYTRDGLHSALCLHTPDFTATAHTEYRGTLTRKRAMFCVTSQSSRVA